jgi:hypothetical protein
LSSSIGGLILLDSQRVTIQEAKMNPHCSRPLLSSVSALTRSLARLGEGLYVAMELVSFARALSTRSKQTSIVLSMTVDVYVGDCSERSSRCRFLDPCKILGSPGHLTFLFVYYVRELKLFAPFE